MKKQTHLPGLAWSCLLLLLACPLPAQGLPIPGKPQNHPVALVGGTLHPVSSPPQAGVLLFEKGRITALGSEVEIPADAHRIDVQGKHIYPGLFEAYSHLGLVEIDAVRSTRDLQESTPINPNVQAHIAVNPDSELIPVARSNGVLLALTAPRGELLAGRSAVLQLDGWTWQDLTLRSNVGLHITWPRMTPRRNWHLDESSQEQLEERDKALRQLRQAFDDARAYRQARQADEARHARDSRWEAMIDVLEGRLPVIIQADELQQIQAAVAFAQQQQIRLILYGGYDAPHCAELLKQHDVPVIVGGVQRLPQRRSDDYDAPFTLPERLRQAGLRFCISGAGLFTASNVRNLPYHAATAAAYGLPADEALKAITLYPAEILAVAERVGSLEVGKDATLIISDGDPLEIPTQVEAAFIQGRPVMLSDRHKRLWRKYQEKYRRLAEPNEAAEPAAAAP